MSHQRTFLMWSEKFACLSRCITSQFNVHKLFFPQKFVQKCLFYVFISSSVFFLARKPFSFRFKKLSVKWMTSVYRTESCFSSSFNHRTIFHCSSDASKHPGEREFPSTRFVCKMLHHLCILSQFFKHVERQLFNTTNLAKELNV